MSSTHREWGLLARASAAWALFTVFAVAAGPFGTLDSLSLTGRIGYWGGCVAVAVGLTVLRLRLVRDDRWSVKLAVQIPYSLALTGAVYPLNTYVFEGWGGWADFLYLLVVIGITVAVVTAGTMVWPRRAVAAAGADHAAAAPSEVAEDPADRFLRRLPFDKRGGLVRLEAQDHYLNVVTGAGAALILMRISDAEAELAGVRGLRVHRSHWVALDAVRRHLRRDGRDFLVMRDGAEVPVSRSYRPAATEAGLI